MKDLTRNNLTLRTILILCLLIIVLNISCSFTGKRVEIIDKPHSYIIILTPSKLKIISLYLIIILIAGIVLEIKFISGLIKKRGLSLPHRLSSSLTARKSLETFILLAFFFSVFRFSGEFLTTTAINPKNWGLFSLLLNALFQIFSLITILALFSKEELGLKIESFRKFLKFFLSGLITYIGIFPILTVSAFISLLILKLLNLKPQPMPLVLFFLQEKNSLFLLILALEAIFSGPLIEEIIFRGIIFRLFRKKFSFLLSSLIGGAIFSFLHYNNFSFLPILTLAVALAYIYEVEKNIFAPFFVHFFHNFLALLILFFIKTG